jgi:hypothetical protein
MDMKKLNLILLSILLIVSSIGFTGCNKNDILESDIYFPTLEEPANAHMDALARGKLMLEGEYILLKSSFFFFSEEMLLIWPYGYSVDVEDGKIHILNENGHIVASVGEYVKIGGGENPISNVEKLIGYSLPEVWEGTCWMVSEIVND